MRRLFVVLVLMAAGILLLSGAGQAAQITSSSPSPPPDDEEHLLSAEEESQPEAQQAMAPVEENRSPRVTKATMIIWFTLGILTVALSYLTWGIPQGKKQNKKDN